MNRVVIRIGLGIAIYLSSSALDSNSSWASSLKYSDRYELTKLSDETSISFGLSLITSEFNFDRSRQSEPPESPDLNFSYIQTPLNPSLARNLQDLFFVPQFNIQIQTATAESEEETLLESITNSLSNLQFSSLEENSFANPNVIILPQVAYEDIYRGLYDFEINVVANQSPPVPRVANNSIPEDLLVTQESISNYNPRSFALQPLRNNSVDDYLSLNGYRSSGEDSSSQPPSSQYGSNQYVSDSPSNLFLSKNSYEDLPTRVREILSNNINVSTVSTNIEEIVPQYRYKGMNGLQQLQRQKNPIQQELEEQLAEQQKIREQQRQNLIKKLENEQKKREQKRQREKKRLATQRQDRLSKLAARQKQAIRNQENRLRN